MPGTCSTCGQALHSDLSRLHGQCGPCRWGEEAAHVPTWRNLIPPGRPPEEAPPAEEDAKKTP